MKIKKPKMKLNQILTYPHLLNPIPTVLIFLFILYTLTLSWWGLSPDSDYIKLVINKNRFIDFLKQILEGFLLVTINTFYFKQNISENYISYLMCKWFPYYEIGDWRREHILNQKYNSYKNSLKK